MKALIVNSTTASRVDNAATPSPFEMLSQNETVFSRQIRILKELGINDFLVCTAGDQSQWIDATDKPLFRGCNFDFIDNGAFANDGAFALPSVLKDCDDDVLLVDSMLIFSRSLVKRILDDKRANLCAYNPSIPVDDDNLKVRAAGQRMKGITFDAAPNDCCAFQPIVKLSKKAFNRFITATENQLVSADDTRLNVALVLTAVLPETVIGLVSYEDDFVLSVSNSRALADALVVLPNLDLSDQRVECPDDPVAFLKECLFSSGCEKPLVVTDSPAAHRFSANLDLGEELELGSFGTQFEAIVAGVEITRRGSCDALVSVGGDDAHNVAKAIRFCLLRESIPSEQLFSKAHFFQADDLSLKPLEGHDEPENGEAHPVTPHLGYRHVAVPLIYDLGGEFTDNCFVECDDQRYCVVDGALLPSLVVDTPSISGEAPDMQMKSRYLGLLAYAIESLLSTKSSAKGKRFAIEGIEMLLSARVGCFQYGYIGIRRLVAQGANSIGKACCISGPSLWLQMCKDVAARLEVSEEYVAALSIPPLLNQLLQREQVASEARRSPFFNDAVNALVDVFEVQDLDEVERLFRIVVAEMELGSIGNVSEDELRSMYRKARVLYPDNLAIPACEDDYVAMFSNLADTLQGDAAPKVSVIVPVYNVEAYLERCLNSLVNQTLHEIEIIVVNDGSSDCSQDIIDRFVSDYPGMVKGYEKANGGLSDARNYGIARATGRYISFVDSDDFVELHFLEEMYSKAVVERADVVACGFVNQYEDKVEKKYYNYEVFNANVRDSPSILSIANSIACNKIFSRAFWLENGFEFPVGQWFEDSALIYNVMLAANKVSFVNFPFYYYCRTREEAITKSFDARVFDIFKSVNSIVSYYKAHGAFELLKEELEYICLRHVLGRLDVMYGGPDKKMARRFADEAYDFFDREFPNWRKNRYLNPTEPGNKAKIKNFIERDELRTKLALSIPAPMFDAGDRAFNSLKTTKNKIRVKRNKEKSEESRRFYIRKNGFKVMADVQQTLRDMDIQSFADFGTCLGLVREGHLLDHDLDVDLGVIAASDRRDEIRIALEKKGYKLWRQYFHDGIVVEESYKYSAVKVDFNYYEMTADYARTWLFYTKPGFKYASTNLRHVVRMDYQPISGIHFREYEGMKISLPNDPERLLAQKYGDGWRTPDTGWIYWQSPAATPMDEIGHFVLYTYQGAIKR